MISIQVPHFANHSLPGYYPMSDTTFHHAMPTFQRPPSNGMLQNGMEISKPKPCLPGAKRRPSRAGTRSVSTLTAAQLERKRANDREAQRAIRQRTKDHIDSLERRVAELSATNETSAKLMQALQRNEELEQENAILRSRLNHAVAAMADGGALNAEILSGATSPNRRLKLCTQVRSSSTPAAPRSVPTPTVAIAPQEHWNGTYSPVSNDESSPSVTDVSPGSTTMRWGPSHQQTSPVCSEADGTLQAMEGGAAVQPPHAINYNYPMTYSPVTDSGLIQSYPAPTSSPSTNGFTPQSTTQITPTVSSPAAFSPFGNGPQSFITTSQHEADANMALMYNMPNGIKADEQ